MSLLDTALPKDTPIARPIAQLPDTANMSGDEKTNFQRYVIGKFEAILDNLVTLTEAKLSGSSPEVDPSKFISALYSVSDDEHLPEGLYMTISIHRYYPYDPLPDAVQKPLTGTIMFCKVVTGHQFGMTLRQDYPGIPKVYKSITDVMFPPYFMKRVNDLADAQVTALGSVTALPADFIIAVKS